MPLHGSPQSSLVIRAMLEDWRNAHIVSVVAQLLEFILGDSITFIWKDTDSSTTAKIDLLREGHV